ncbi:MAG: energy transducer TonB [Pseudomonas sp.]|nr:energy transducer TonB [Pseudomonas sp.]
MNRAPMPAAATWPLAWPARAWRRQAVALSGALLLHGLALIALLGSWQAKPAAEPQVRTLTTQLISLAPAAVVAPALAPVAPAALPEPAAVAPAPVAPPLAPPPLAQAALARKRLQQLEQQREQQREQLEQQREQAREQARDEQLLAERRRDDQQRSAALAQQQASQQAAAAADARARAAADASRQYLPIAKEAPDYPDRALDKGVEGDCSVSYTVTAQGRVDNPQVAGDCHPLFVRPSLAAAKTFRYQPRIVDGHAVAVANVRNTFHYRIQD